jgi:hypothetical protein
MTANALIVPTFPTTWRTDPSGRSAQNNLTTRMPAACSSHANHRRVLLALGKDSDERVQVTFFNRLARVRTSGRPTRLLTNSSTNTEKHHVESLGLATFSECYFLFAACLKATSESNDAVRHMVYAFASLRAADSKWLSFWSSSSRITVSRAPS